jgi:hypothetical protein
MHPFSWSGPDTEHDYLAITWGMIMSHYDWPIDRYAVLCTCLSVIVFLKGTTMNPIPGRPDFYNLCKLLNFTSDTFQSLASQAGVERAVIAKMFVGGAVERADAEKVLAAISQIAGETRNLENTRVVLTEGTEWCQRANYHPLMLLQFSTVRHKPHEKAAVERQLTPLKKPITTASSGYEREESPFARRIKGNGCLMRRGKAHDWATREEQKWSSAYTCTDSHWVRGKS